MKYIVSVLYLDLYHGIINEFLSIGILLLPVTLQAVDVMLGHFNEVCTLSG